MYPDFFQNTSHRPWPLPEKAWRYYQEWNNAIFLHWCVDSSELKKIMPSSIEIDSFEGNSWISLVAFTMEKVKPAFLPSISAISNFHEINIRTYVCSENKPGVYFLSIEAEKYLSSFIAKSLSGLPYKKSSMKRYNVDTYETYTSLNVPNQFEFNTSFKVGAEIEHPTALDRWLTERYCLYFDKLGIFSGMKFIINPGACSILNCCN